MREKARSRLVCLGLAFFLTSGTTAQEGQGNWEKFQDPQSKERGNCPECQDGEAMAISTVSIPNSGYVDIDNPPCGDPSFNSVKIPDAVKTAAVAYFKSQTGGTGGQIASYAVGFSEQIINAAAAAASVDAGTLGQLVRRSTCQPQVSSCGRAMVTLPATVDITRMVPSMHCPAGGWCHSDPNAVTESLGSGLIAASVVGKNWSHNNGTTLTLKVFYKRKK